MTVIKRDSAPLVLPSLSLKQNSPEQGPQEGLRQRLVRTRYSWNLNGAIVRSLEAPTLDGEEPSQRGLKDPPGRLQKREKDLPLLFTRKSLLSPLSVLRQTPSETPSNKKENPQAYLLEGSPFENGGYLLSHFYAVPSAWLGLTSLFGMGRGGTPTL